MGMEMDLNLIMKLDTLEFVSNFVGRERFAAFVEQVSNELNLLRGLVFWPGYCIGKFLKEFIESLNSYFSDHVIQADYVEVDGKGLNFRVVRSSGVVAEFSEGWDVKYTGSVTHSTLGELLSKYMLWVGAVPFDEQFTGAEAQDCEQGDSDTVMD